MKTVTIVIEGVVRDDWGKIFDNLVIGVVSANRSVLKGQVRDHTQLRGISNKLADLGLSLVSVNVLPDKTRNV